MESKGTRTLAITPSPGQDYPQRIKALRAELGMTQVVLAKTLGVSFPTVNRWENGKVRPSKVCWARLKELAGEAESGDKAVDEAPDTHGPSTEVLDFTASPEIVKLLAEGERLSFGHLMNPAFATEISNIDPLPHQRIAVYDHMLKQDRLRFLLADDAGAGKTIMTGLYIREMLSRRLLRRILIVTPAGLLGNWRRELATLFGLHFRIVSGADARNENPFIGEDSHRVIISMDTLSNPGPFFRLRSKDALPYDLVVFDEAHKLSADRGNDMRIRKTKRYNLAEALAGVRGLEDRWTLGWSAQHLLFLTATPHMGKAYPYYSLWRLLEPDILSTPEAFEAFPPEQRAKHFIRRTKEEMVFLDGKPLYPKRSSDTLGYALSQGEVSEQTLYDETTDYLRFVYNKAKLLNRGAARLAMGVFQRRLASSTYALLRSLERRVEKLDQWIRDVEDGRVNAEQLVMLQQRLFEDAGDVLDTKTADEEEAEGGREENEIDEDKILEGVVAASISDLLAERDQVQSLVVLARRVHDQGQESKFEKLEEILTSPKYAQEKFIIFSEHRDTMDFLVKRLDGLGYTGQIVQIHGGMHHVQRDEAVERFKKKPEEGGARFLICTDAAGEGINLQFCWIMINYDIPWNPARLEQRMGRIHRYGQKHDPVVILNLLAPDTREGRVLKVLLDKLEKIRKELGSDKVFDSIGRVFEGLSIRKYMELAVTGDLDEVAEELDGKLTKEQIQALEAREKALFGPGGDVSKELPRLREGLEREVYLRLLPGYVRQYVEQAAPLVDLKIDGDPGRFFTFRPQRLGAMDPLLPALECYPENARQHLSVSRPLDHNEAIWLHPGEPVFEALRALVSERLSQTGGRGAVFMDPTSEKPYLFHLALMSVVRAADPNFPGLSKEEDLECRLVGLKQYEGADLILCPIEHLLLLKGGQGLPPGAQRLAVKAGAMTDQASAFLLEREGRNMALNRKKEFLEILPERKRLMERGFDYREAELAVARVKHSEKAQRGNRKAVDALAEVKQQQKQLAERKADSLAFLNREPELIVAGPVTFVAHALVAPSSDPHVLEQHEINVEQAAMKIAQAFEEAAGATVHDVHTPELARTAGLPDNPGFDLLSVRPGNDKRAIEVKGRAETGDVEVSANEWAKACNLRKGYWLYAVYDCATPNPRLIRVQDPFGNLLAKAKGSVLIGHQKIAQAAKMAG